MIKVIYPESEYLVSFNQISIGGFFIEDDTRELYIKTDIETAVLVSEVGFTKCFENDDYCYPVDVEIRASFKNRQK